MEEKKSAEFWETEGELRKILLLINAQLEITQQVLSSHMPKLQERFLHFAQLGEELGVDVEGLGVKKFYDLIKNNKLFQVNDSLRDDMGSEKGHDAR